MKKLLFVAVFTLCSAMVLAQEFKVITIVESIVPAGIGRSRMIEHSEDLDHSEFTTQREEGTDTDQGKVRRRDAKIDELKETKLLNFYSVTGINFRNIASNDAIITSKLNQMAKEGWKLAFVTSGVESEGGKTDGHGIFITRLFFQK